MNILPRQNPHQLNKGFNEDQFIHFSFLVLINRKREKKKRHEPDSN